MPDAGLVGAYVAGLFGFAGAVWTAARARATAGEVEKLKALYARENDLLKSQFEQERERKWQQRMDALARVNDQLRSLYGPLRALSRASHTSWLVFRSKYRPQGAFWRKDDPPTPEDAKAWRLWMTHVFMPINLEMERLVLGQAHLVEDSSLDESMATLCAHVASYKTVLDRWNRGDFTEHTPPVEFPRGFQDEVDAVYRRLRQRQGDLLRFAEDAAHMSPSSPERRRAQSTSATTAS